MAWLDSFHGEAIWPAHPLPPVEEYAADLEQRFSKLKVPAGDLARASPAARRPVLTCVNTPPALPCRHFSTSTCRQRPQRAQRRGASTGRKGRAGECASMRRHQGTFAHAAGLR
jgi:hypothetical protein